MADSDNPGQFGKRPDTKKMASEAGKKSGGNFAKDPERASEAGKKGAKNQPISAKREGGLHSHDSDSD